MKVGKHYEFKKINHEDLVLLASQLNLKPKTILDCYFEIIEKIEKAFDKVRSDSTLIGHEKTIDVIEKNILRID